MFLKSTVAIVTGENRGIGKAIVLDLAEQRADVAIDYLSRSTPTSAQLPTLQVRETELLLNKEAAP